MWPVLGLLLFATRVASGDDLRVDVVRRSLTATNVRYQQYIDGIPVVGGVRVESIHDDGRREVTDHLAAGNGRRAASGRAKATATPGNDVVYLNDNGVARLVSRQIVEKLPHQRYVNYFDADTGALVRSEALFWPAQARVFDPNPVAKLNAPNLQDQNDAPAAVPDAAYSIVDLLDLQPAGMLAGPNVQIVDSDTPHTPHADASQSLMFERSQPQFEEVNAYYHIDKSQRYLQSLGYVGSRQLVAYSIPVDPHAVSGQDNSFFTSTFVPGEGALFFGDGGTDDAEDSDVMMHEFGHAIQEWIAPGAFGGASSSQSRALAEGWSDYWSFSSSYPETAASGRDPFCIADWDARCWQDDASQLCSYPVGADCLRRVDSRKSMADYVPSDVSGTEHKNGEIFSSAMREIFMSMVGRYGVDRGKRMTDTLLLEATFGLTSAPTFASIGQKLLDADQRLNAGANSSVICTAMTARGILAGGDCNRAPRGEVTWFQSGDHGVIVLPGNTVTSSLTITDARPINRVTVNVSTDAEAQVSLTGPDGTSAASPSLDVFKGRPAGGTWTLTLRAVSAPVTLRSWSLAIEFAGDLPATSRPLATAGRQKTIAVVGHTPGANGTLFISDVRLFNRGNAPANAMLIFTPSSADGNATFAAIKVVVGPSQVMALDDIVQNAMLMPGSGNLAIVGATEQLIASSRTYTRGVAGTFGQYVPSAEAGEAIGSGDPPLSIPQLENSTDYRSNFGFAEIGGSPGAVHVRYFDASGNVADEQTYGVAPFSHGQTRVTASGQAVRAEVSVAGDARVLAYGSVVDNRSGDAVYIPAARIRRGFLPAIHAPGAFGTLWRTDVWLSNSSEIAEPVAVDNVSTVSVPARGAIVLRDILRSDGQRVLLINGSPALLVTSRTYTGSSDGTFGQFVPATPAAMRRGDAAATFIGVESSPAFRTNIGLMPASGEPATVRIIAYDAAGRELARRETAVEGLTQIPLWIGVVDGRVTVEVIDGRGGVIPYASIIDNVSGDPIYINAQY